MDDHELELHDLKIIYYYNGHREETSTKVINSVYQANKDQIGTVRNFSDIAKIEDADRQAREEYTGHMVEFTLRISHSTYGNSVGVDRCFWVSIDTYEQYQKYQPQFSGNQTVPRIFAKGILDQSLAFMDMAKEKPKTPQPIYDNLQIAREIFS